MKTKKYLLKSVYLYFSKYCNLNCRHCWINPDFTGMPDDNGGNKKDIELRYIINALKQAKKLGLRTVKITGGEPFLRKDIIELFKWIKKNQLNMHIETNGTLIGEKEAKAVRDYKVMQVAVSLDGPDEQTHEKLRNVKGSFKNAVNGIRQLRKYNPGLSLQVICSLWNENKSKMKQMIDLCAALRVNSLKINPIMNVSRADIMKSKGELLTIGEILKTNKKMKSYMSRPRLKKKLKLCFDIPPAFKTIEELKTEKCVCGIKSIIGITGDGTISICGIGSVVKELNMGNIKDTKLKQVWENNKILNIIRKDVPLKLEGICGKCMMKNFCLGKCRAEAYWEQKSFLAPFVFCKIARDEGLFPETRVLNTDLKV